MKTSVYHFTDQSKTQTYIVSYVIVIFFFGNLQTIIFDKRFGFETYISQGFL